MPGLLAALDCNPEHGNTVITRPLAKTRNGMPSLLVGALNERKCTLLMEIHAFSIPSSLEMNKLD